MSGRIRIAFKRLCARFLARCDGSVLPLFTLSLVPIVGLVGAAVDYSRANNIRSGLRGALDSALLAGARDGSTNWADVVANFFNSNLQLKGGTISSANFSLTADRAYAGAVSAVVPTNFLGLFGINSINVDVSATATVAPVGGSYCVLALNPTAQQALQLTGNASITITAPNCVLQVNSSNIDAVDMTGNSLINSVKNCFVGGVRKYGNSSISPAPDAKCTSVPDPFTAPSFRPFVEPCKFTNYNLSGNKTVTL